MKYEMKLHKVSFDKIKSGLKRIESRLNDEKRKLLKVGDEIVFILRDDESEKISVHITELLCAKDFEELFKKDNLNIFGWKDGQDSLDIYKYYTKEEEKKFGVVGIRFRIV